MLLNLLSPRILVGQRHFGCALCPANVHTALAKVTVSLVVATPGITFTTVLLVAARCFMRLHFSYRGTPDDLWAMTLMLTSCAICRAEAPHTLVKCEACGLEERLVKQEDDYARAKRMKVRKCSATHRGAMHVRAHEGLDLLCAA